MSEETLPPPAVVELERELEVLRGRCRLLMALSVVLLAGLSGGLALHFWHLRQGPPSVVAARHEMVATVDGERITRQEWENNLRVVHGPQVLRRLAEQKMVAREAVKEKVSLDDSASMAELAKLSKQNPDPKVYGVLEPQLRAHLLERKMLLKGVEEKTRHHLFTTFKDQLVQYDLARIVLATAGDAVKVEKSLQRGDSFEKTGAAYSIEAQARQTGGHLGLLTLWDISNSMGPQAADVVSHMKEYTFSAPVETSDGIVILQVGKIRSSYDDLKPAIDDLIVHPGEGAFIYRITAGTHLSSFHAEDAGGDASPSPVASNHPGSATPSAATTTPASPGTP